MHQIHRHAVAAATFLLLGLAFLAASAEAQVSPSPFSESSVYAYTDAGLLSDIRHGDKTLGILNLGGGYCVFEGICLNGELAGYGIDQGDGGSGAIGLNFIPRWHFLRWERTTLYLDGGVGIFYDPERFPLHGTRFNFTEQAGLGLTYGVSERLTVNAGSRYLHLSNANLGDHNEGVDAMGGYLGLMYFF